MQPIVLILFHVYNGNYEVMKMSEPYLKYRKRFTSSLKNELVEPFNKLAEQTRITKTKLLDEAIEDLLKKHNFKN